MKKLLLLWLLFFPLLISAQEKSEKYTILLTGASFASSNNGWFELGCDHLDAKAINRAIGGEAIANTANKMAEGALYTQEELEDMDAFVIMHVHDRDVYEDSQVKDNLEEYALPFDRSNYAATYDYVIKKYINDCYNLKFNTESKYYNTMYGKPAVVVLCTHWHDSRPVFNTSVRQLALKWGFPLVEFDRYIGFSKNQPYPVNGEQYSIQYALDKETVNGVVYGWHPLQGKDKYIQQRMAAIFADTMRRILPLK